MSAASEGSAVTQRRVALALAGMPDGASAAEIAALTGLSRVSARRYLQQLLDAGQALVEPQYGAAGRPELRYRPVD
ncbi:helix-turn-helix domain-containing protein [Microbacterium nymphoidis]|uniref:helix-turn-helix domain-containing protein n=1 Tax=Microbacterium nymphoidis TaxID=2898586 RepID=UPI001E600072|nr:helix-turn-helix domain-containing protein [Microbacterium nymphoidis]MCD2496994.1 helix-turn-helix domain-containing protein [Microbacterium nymphoidis]